MGAKYGPHKERNSISSAEERARRYVMYKPVYCKESFMYGSSHGASYVWAIFDICSHRSIVKNYIWKWRNPE